MREHNFKLNVKAAKEVFKALKDREKLLCIIDTQDEDSDEAINSGDDIIYIGGLIRYFQNKAKAASLIKKNLMFSERTYYRKTTYRKLQK